MQNEAQYDLGRKAAKISALFSNNLDKYEYLTGDYLDLKPSTVEQPRFEYSQLGKFLYKGLKEKDKKERLLKRLKNIEDKNEEQLKAIEDRKGVQAKIISKSKIKSPLSKSIYSQEVKDGRINGDEAKKYSKLLKVWRVVKLTTLDWCAGQVIISILTLLDLDRYLVLI